MTAVSVAAEEAKRAVAIGSQSATAENNRVTAISFITTNAVVASADNRRILCIRTNQVVCAAANEREVAVGRISMI